jgi:recombinational DNA repair protein RecT
MTTAPLSPLVFLRGTQEIAKVSLQTSCSPQELARTAGRISQAIMGARATARNPEAWDALLATPEGKASLAAVVVQASELDIMPGGPSPLAWIIPQAPRKGEPVQARYSLSHRGAAVVAAREGYTILPVAVHVQDSYRVEFGECVEHLPTAGDPVNGADLAGVYVTIRRDGKHIARPWVSVQIIDSHRLKSKMPGSGPWADTPIPMALKTAIHYIVARGILPLTSATAREALIDATVIDIPSTPTPTRRHPEPTTEPVTTDGEEAP